MSKPTMFTKQPSTTGRTRLQEEIGDKMDAELGRIGTAPPRGPTTTLVRRKQDLQAFVMPVAWIEADPDQVRQQGKTSDDPAVQELAESIREHGLRNPIEVREIVANQQYRIVAGEGRFVACTQILKWSEVRVTLVNAEPEQILWLQLHENIHRRELHPLDLAKALQGAIDDGLPMDAVVRKTRKSKSWVQKALTVGRDLTSEAEAILKESPQGESLDTAYEVSTVEPEEQKAVAETIVAGKLGRDQVRDLTRDKKRSGDSHHSGRVGRKPGKKPYNFKWKHAETGLTFSVTSRKKNVADEELLQAAKQLVESLSSKMERKEAA